MPKHIQGFSVTAIAISPINLLDLIDPKKCYALVRFIRWGERVTCPNCGSHHVIKRGFDDTQPERQRYQCKHCQARFDDLSNTIFALSSSATGRLDSLSLSNGVKPVE